MKVIKTIGRGEFNSKTPCYNTWKNMMNRCYNKYIQEIKPAYIDCIVCDEWFNFQVFAKWYTENQIEGFVLDKDILIKGNKLYSPDTCTFVPKEINGLFTLSTYTRGKYPVGIVERNGKYRARVSIENKQTVIGTYPTIQLAFNAYKSVKESIIKDMATKYKNQLTEICYNSLMNWSIDIED